MRYTLLRDGGTFYGYKNQAGPELACHGIISSGFHPVIVRLTVIVRDFAFPTAAAREMHTSIERGMSGYRIGMQAAHRRALRYDAHVVYLRHCTLIHVAIQRHNFERTHGSNARTNVNLQRRERTML